tara:strand:+ start:511 stop:1068 length:558 start_codon:yes stop_codon:yes gene_type:complete
VNRLFKVLLIYFLITGCSFQKNSKFWNNEKIVKEKQQKITEIFKKEETLNSEFNKNLKIKIESRATNNTFLNNLNNNDGRINYNGNLENISKYKFKKIENFHHYESEITFNQNNIIFFDNKGSILSFDDASNLLWKKNYYSKSEIKLNPFLFFGHNNKILIIADNIARLYAVDINTGKLLWKKKK